jgi:flagellar hook-associated protein 1 FlgK
MESMMTGGECNYGIWSDPEYDKLVEQESLLPHLSQNGKVNYDLAQKVAALWKGEYLTLDPDDTNKVTFIDYYNNMVGAFGTIGSVYESTAKSLSGTVTAVDNQRSQVMGVSSDEELTKMIKFQNAYNASSRFINVVNEMIESMITQLGS